MKRSADDEVVIKRDKIYTSYFARAAKIVPDRRLVSIALLTPEGWKGKYYRKLNPSISLLSSYKNGEVTPEEYEDIYKYETLSNNSAKDVYEELKGCVLCCWEKPEDFCHRKLVLKWLAEELGEDVIGGEI